MKIMEEDLKICTALGFRDRDEFSIFNGDELLGNGTIILDDDGAEQYRGILVFNRFLAEKDIYKIARVLQNTFIECGDVEMFIEVYFGVHYGMICDERPEIWNQMICPDKN